MFFFDYKKTKCVNGCELFNDAKNYSYWENKKETLDEIEIFLIRIIHQMPQKYYISV